MSGGLLVSTTQCSSSPLSFLESNFRKQWGLAQNHCVTVAFIVTFLSVLNAAAPWCAKTGTEIADKTTTTRKSALRLLRTPSPPGLRTLRRHSNIERHAIRHLALS